MKLSAKLMIAIMLLAGIGLPMIMKGPNGKPIMALSDWLPNVSSLRLDDFTVENGVEQLKSLVNIDREAEPSVDNVVQAASSNSFRQLKASSSQMYKWQDESGRWHFSSEKPVETVEAHVEQLPEMENLMQAPVKKQEKSSSMGILSGLGL